MLTSVNRTVGVSNGHPRVDDGRVLEDVRTVVSRTGFRRISDGFNCRFSDPKATTSTAAPSSRSPE